MLYPVWLIFAAVFFTFGYQHWRLAQQEIRPFRMRQGGEPATQAGKDAHSVLVDFVQDFNQYLEMVNGADRGKHRVAMIAYIVAGLVALVSAYQTAVG